MKMEQFVENESKKLKIALSSNLTVGKSVFITYQNALLVTGKTLDKPAHHLLNRLPRSLKLHSYETYMVKHKDIFSHNEDYF